MQDCSNSITLAMELLQSCTKPSISCEIFVIWMPQKTVAFDDRSTLVHVMAWYRQQQTITWASIHYNDVTMSVITSQIISLTIVYSTVYSSADQRNHQSSASLAFVWGIHQDRWIPRAKGHLRGKCFHLMTSSCWSSFMPSYIPSLWVDLTFTAH